MLIGPSRIIDILLAFLAAFGSFGVAGVLDKASACNCVSFFNQKKKKKKYTEKEGRKRRKKTDLLTKETDFDGLKDLGSEGGLVEEVDSAGHDPVLETVKVISDEVLLEGVALVGAALEDHAQDVGAKHLDDDVDDSLFHLAQLLKEQRDARETIECGSGHSGHFLCTERQHRLDDLLDERNAIYLFFCLFVFYPQTQIQRGLRVSFLFVVKK